MPWEKLLQFQHTIFNLVLVSLHYKAMQLEKIEETN